LAKDVIITPLDGDIQFQNSSGTNAGLIEQSGDDLAITNAVGDVLIGDGSSDLFIGDGTSSVDIVFDVNGSVRGESGVTLTLGASGSTTAIAGLSSSSETSAVMRNTTTGALTYRTLGSNAFNSTTIPTNNNQLTNGAGYITSFDITTQTDPKYLRSNASDTTTGNITIGKDNPVLALNDTSTNNSTTLISYVSFKAQGTEKGFVGYGSGGTDYLYLRNNDGRIDIQGSGGIYLNNDTDISGDLEVNGSITADDGTRGIRMFMDASGNGDRAGIVFDIDSADGIGVGSDYLMIVQDGINEAKIQTASAGNGDLRFLKGTADLMMLKGSANLILGGVSSFTTGGTAEMTIDLTANTQVALAMGLSNTNMSYIRQQGDGKFQWQTYNGSNTGELHLQPYGGNVGIGETSPATKLNVNVGAGGQNTTVGLRVGGLNNYPSLELGIEGNYTGVIRSYGNDLKYYSGHWRTIGNTASEDHRHYWYTSKNGSTNWSTAKMTLDEDGYLGIGTTSPATELDVDGTTTTNKLVADDTSTIGFSNLANACILAGTTSLGIGIDSNEIRNNGGHLYIGTIGANDINFGTGGTNNQVIIKSGGNVDITGTLGITRSADDFITFTRTGAREWRHKVDSGGHYYIRNQTASNNVLTLTDDNKVGISVTSPSAKLQINGGMIVGGTTFNKNTNSYNSGNIALDNGSSDSGGIHFYYANNSNFGIDVASSEMRFVHNLDESGGSVKMSLNTSGELDVASTTTISENVNGAFRALLLNNERRVLDTLYHSELNFQFAGIDAGRIRTSMTEDFLETATESSQMLFSVRQNGTLQNALLISESRAVTFYNDLYVPDQIIHSGDTNCYMQFHNNDQWRVVTGGAERIEVSNTGIIINDGSNDYDFRVESNGNANMIKVNGGNDAVGIGIDPSSGIALHVYHATADAPMKVQSGDAFTGITFQDNSSNNHLFYKGSENHFYFNGSGVTLGVGVNSITTTNLSLDVENKVRASGIMFGSDTADANTLDDYEEGTFTPTIHAGATLATAHSNNYGKYTRIGNVVHCSGRLQTTSVTNRSSSTNVEIGGFPFVANTPLSSGTGAIAGAIGLSSGFSGEKPTAIQIRDNETNAFLYYQNASLGFSNIKGDDFSSTSNTIVFQITYHVA